MKAINRFYLAASIFTMLLAYCAFISENKYFNCIVIMVGIIATITYCDYIFAHLNKNEKAFLYKIFG